MTDGSTPATPAGDATTQEATGVAAAPAASSASAAPPASSASTAPAAPAVSMPAPTAPVVARRRNRWLDVALAFAAVVAIGGIAFAVGRFTAPTTAFGGNGQGRNFGNGGGGFGPGASLAPGQTPGPGFRGGFGETFALQGTVTEVTADHITIKTESGQTVQVPLDSNTAYHREAGATATDVQPNTKVLVQLQTGNGGNGGTGGGGIRTGQLPPASNVTITGQ
jgi:hypothetical protein